ncbi:MAG: hypothetical protein NT061_08975 [Spirochaetes bacterium]|nr:hypothetical protein [Spirochaetota bacterium]
MKKLVLVLGIATSVIFTSCTIMPAQLHLLGAITLGESESKTSLVTISVQPAWAYSGPGNGNGNAQGQKGHDRITSFSVVFRNTTNSPVLVVWGKSSLKYNNGAFSPFIQGQKYEDSARPMDATVIPPYGTIRKYIYSSQQLYSDSGKHNGWKMRSIEAKHVVLVFCVQSRDIEDYYTVVVQ